MPGRSVSQPIRISSPVPRSPDAAYFDETPPDRGYNNYSLPSRGNHGVRRARGDEVDGLGLGPIRSTNGHDDYTSSPTHAYLEAFDSYPSTPDPAHSPIPGSPSFDSPGLHSMTEKDPLDAAGGPGFGANQYASDRYLAPLPRRPGDMEGYQSHYTKTSRLASGGSRVPSKPYKKKRTCVPESKAKRRWLFIGLPLGIVLVAGVALGVVFGLGLNKNKGTTGSGSGNSGSGTSGTTGSNITNFGVAGQGTNGSMVTTDLNVNFTYINWFGGSWAQNPQNPYSVSGRAQSWSPSLLEKWVWGQHIVRGVNLGGWLVTEPFIVPALYEKYQNTTPQAIDEYTLSQAIGKDLATVMENHYKTFITEEDFADIAKKGLNWVRIPIGFWAIETQPGEPYLQGVSWKYFVKAIGWARKYGIRILLDFHALPGSQNGWNHSGRGIGVVNWMYGVMGIANAQRSLEQIRSMVEFISQDGIKQVVPAISLVNEVQASIVTDTALRAFYYQAYTLIRSITGYGASNGPIIVIHEGFEGIAEWNGFLAGADRLALDQHPYLAFGDVNNNPWDQQIRQVCSWGGGTNDTQTSFGIVLGGEWSNAINNCGKWLTGVNSVPSYQTKYGNCTAYEEYFNWSPTMKSNILNYSSASMDALQNWFFWTWKIGTSSVLGYPPSPFWHYKLGVENGWIPSDPRTAGGYCKGIGVGGGQFAGVFPASATGAVSTSAALANTSLVAVWPPATLGPNFTVSAQVALFPTLTRTGSPVTLATAAHPSNATIGSGWACAGDAQKAYVTVAGCSYPDAYNATASSLVPTALCTGGGKRDVMEPRVAAVPVPTPAPVS